MLEIRTLELYPDYRWAAAEQHWQRRQYDVPPVEPIPLCDWLALLIEIAGAVVQALRRTAPQRTSGAECECTARRLSLREIRALPLHQPAGRLEDFSLN